MIIVLSDPITVNTYTVDVEIHKSLADFKKDQEECADYENGDKVYIYELPEAKVYEFSNSVTLKEVKSKEKA